uniref:Uncharacterized protein LOC100181738 n=1 Tax=Phallusia mammillata TaxID=59560 RepID=A0A6F9DI87_9ASCI|nr:uncharacterized protein LOC100181738 [Phallusia mammillata]
MKILCVGFWKTGTKSLSKALTHLGYNVYDYEEQLVNLKTTWNKFFDGTITDKDIYETFKDIDVLIDGPVIVFWEEIYRVFPEAKVILTIRDEDGWWKSWKNMQDDFFAGSYLLRISIMVSPTARKFLHSGVKIFGMAYGFDNSLSPFSMDWNANERLYKMKYRKHNCYVLHTVPEDKRLVHISKEGWEPICKYLDHDVPKIPYPHQNKNASLFKEQMAGPLFKQIIKEFKLIVAFLCVVVIVVLAWWLAK